MILGDSLSLPRDYPETVKSCDTWPEFLRRSGIEIVQASIGGGTIEDLYLQSNYYKAYDPGRLIVQSGIVDCAPRALTAFEKNLIASNRYLSAVARRVLPLQKMRRYRKVTYTSPELFRSYIEKIITSFANAEVYFLTIVPAFKEYEKIVPGIQKNIRRYNEILINTCQERDPAECISLSDIPAEGVMTDGHHLSGIGHKWVGEKVLEKI